MAYKKIFLRSQGQIQLLLTSLLEAEQKQTKPPRLGHTLEDKHAYVFDLLFLFFKLLSINKNL